MNTEIPHPRSVFEPLCGDAADMAFVDAIERNRLHHAWMLVGPRGVGKATFAYRAARRLLGADAAPAYGALGSWPEDPVCRQIMAKSHPDLLVLQRDTEDGKSRRGIPVDEARSLPEFFSKSPAIAAYRVAIVDAADDLNLNAANAVLKTLEEPPERGVLFLVSHSPGSLLPTLRSRCRRLRFSPPSISHAINWVSGRAEIDPDDAERLLGMSSGAPGLAWRLGAEGALEIDDQVRLLLSQLPRPDPSLVSAWVERFRHPAGMEKFGLFFNRMAENIHALVQRRISDGEKLSLSAWAEVWEYLVQLPGAVEAVNLDRGDAFLTALGRLRAVGQVQSLC